GCGIHRRSTARRSEQVHRAPNAQPPLEGQCYVVRRHKPLLLRKDSERRAQRKKKTKFSVLPLPSCLLSSLKIRKIAASGPPQAGNRTVLRRRAQERPAPFPPAVPIPGTADS